MLNPSVWVWLFVVISHPHYSAHLLVLRSEPTGPQRPTAGPCYWRSCLPGSCGFLDTLSLWRGLGSVRCAYFVGEPITNSFPKPQRFKSQVHNCSLNQSANFVVSVQQTVGLESFIHEERLSVARIKSRRKYYSVLGKITFESEKIPSILGLWFTYILH